MHIYEQQGFLHVNHNVKLNMPSDKSNALLIRTNKIVRIFTAIKEYPVIETDPFAC